MTLNSPRSCEEVSRLLAHLHDRRQSSWEGGRLNALAWTVSLTGVRLGEGIRSWRADYDLVGPSLHVNPARGRLKTEGSDRRVPLPELLAGVLADWLPRTGCRWAFPGVRRKGPWTGGSTGKTRALDSLQLAASEAGVGRLTWHSLRHSFGTTALGRWDVPLWVVSRVMGHSDLRTTQRYLHLRESPRIAAAMRPVRY